MSEMWLGAGFFAFVLTAVAAAGYFFLRSTEQRRAQTPATLSPRGELGESRAVFADLFQSIGENFPAARNEKNPYRVKLAAAGYRWAEALAIFYGIKCGSSLFFAGLFGIFSQFHRGEASLAVMPMICGLGIGFLLPDRVLSSRVQARARRLRNAIPAALDLVVLLYLELRASSSRADSFRALGARNKEPELRKLANLLVDSDRYGVSIGPALRSHSKHLRTRFRQQAQEKARKVGVKLIFPVFFLIFPSVLLVTLGPACMMMYQQLQQLLL